MSRGRSRRQSIDEYLYGRGKYAKARSNKSNKQNHCGSRNYQPSNVIEST